MSVNAILQGQEGKKTRWQCNPNLLDNWYFVGGGSQQGGGQFPINQRGQTEYTTANQYTIDRWRLHSYPGASLTVESDGVVVKGIDWGQSLENSRIPAGTYTASILTADGKIGSITQTFTKDESTSMFGALGDTGVILNFIFHWTTTATLFALQTLSPVKIAAAKLELGPVQTLAHKEGDTWVLNEVPDYREELAKCQAYYWESEMIYSAWHPETMNLYNCLCNVKFPVTMRTVPKVTIVARDGTKNAVSDWGSGLTILTDAECNVATLTKDGFNSIASSTGFANYSAIQFKVIADAEP